MTFDRRELAGIYAGGMLGALARVAIDRAFPAPAGSWPWATLAINVSGTFLLGLVSGLGLSGHALLLAGTAAVGAYTTFSTWMLETHRLAQDAERRAAAINVAVSRGAGLAAVALGRLVGG